MVSKSPEWADLRVDFRAYCLSRGLSPATAQNYSSCGAVFARWCDREGISYESATTEQISAFVLQSPQSLQSARLYGLRAFYRWLGVEDPSKDIRVRPLHPRPKKPFSDEDLKRLVAVCRTRRERALLLTFISTGARRSEVTGMRTEDFQGNGELLIRGKGAKERVVYLDAAAQAAVQEYLAGRTGPVWLVDDHMSPRKFRGKPLGPQGIAPIMKRLGQRAKVEDVHAHRFRTTFAHRFLTAGGDPGALQYLLGHSNLRQTVFYAQYGAAERALDLQRKLAMSGRLVAPGQGVAANGNGYDAAPPAETVPYTPEQKDRTSAMVADAAAQRGWTVIEGGKV